MHTEEEYYHKADNLIRISCQAVQDVFRGNWKQITGREWTEAGAQDFIEGQGKDLYSKCKDIQKDLLKKGKVEEWDLALLADIFHLKCFVEQDHAYDRNRKVRKAVQTLRNERNQLTHNAQKKISSEAYQQVEATVRDSLIKQGVNKQKIDKRISQAGITSSVVALEQARQIKKQGDKEFSKGNYREAVQKYDEALLVPSLLPVNLCRFFEKRADCHFKLGRKEQNQASFYDQAMNDAMEALSNNESSWKAHSILGKIYKDRNELEKAIEHFTRASAICPSEASLKEALDDCTFVHGSIVREDHTDPMRMHPKSLNEFVERYSQFFKVAPEKFRKFLEDGNKMLPGLADVLEGHKCANGWTVEKNYQEAARHFAKAMNSGNAEGTYNLALLYQVGNGVQKDLSYATQLLKKAANMPQKVKVGEVGQMDIGVRAAQHSLGLKYHEGVGLKQDYEEAAKWYRKAVKSGCGQAANNLAILHFEGKGVKQDLKIAERYWKKAAERGNVNAAQSLCNYYLREQEPQMSTLWLEKAIQVDLNRLPFVKDGLMENIDRVTKQRNEMEPIVKKFEEESQLNTEGLTFRERQDRMKVGGEMHQISKDISETEGAETDEKGATEVAETGHSKPSRPQNSKKKKSKEKQVQAEGPSGDYLKDPTRITLVKEHRQYVHDLQKGNLEDDTDDYAFPSNIEFQQKKPTQLVGLQEIKLRGMDTCQDLVYEGKILNLTLIEDPILHAKPSIQTLAMDDNRDTIRLFISHVPHNEEMRRKLGFGCRLSVLNPLRSCDEQTNGIRVDEPSCIFYLAKVERMCRYCGKADAVKNCVTCKWAYYCDRECQLADWKELKHKLICKP